LRLSLGEEGAWWRTRMKFAISSCWNSHRHDDGYEMLKELSELGFRHVELSHGIRLSLVPGILRALEEDWMAVASVHNFCPLPLGVTGAAPNLFEPSAASRRERLQWLNATRKTLDFAKRVKAERVVVHSGRVRFLFSDPGKRFAGALEEQAPDLELVRSKALKRVRGAYGRFEKRLLESYEAIAAQASEHGLLLGVENREGFTEMPLDSEMEPFLKRLEDSGVYRYWHDAGHAQLKERMGISSHAGQLEALRPYLTGFHLHDVNEEGEDHQVPGTGTIDWSMVASHIRPGDTVVLELSPRLRSRQVVEGAEFLENLVPALRR
jgi:sugar phosphate isomerase/epimerase